MKRIYLITVLTILAAIAASFGLHQALSRNQENEEIKVGVVYIGDASTTYTDNFIAAVEGVKRTFGDRVEIIPKYNIHEGFEATAFDELIESGCKLIFSTSYGFGVTAKDFAARYPGVQFCQATCENANEEPILPNYHTFMGRIYEGWYISGVAAGLKLNQLVKDGELTAGQAKAGFVAAFPYAETISAYTAFLLGIRSIVPEAVMDVIYVNTWGDYTQEKAAAERLIAGGCTIIAQDPDTAGAAVACENTDPGTKVYHIAYNQSMIDVAPTTTLTGCRNNWEPYMEAAVQAVLENKRIEEVVKGHIIKNDACAGFDQDGVRMLRLNEVTAAPGTAGTIEMLIRQFSHGGIRVFQGNYTGVDPFDPSDAIDLSKGYTENATASAPSFHYVLQDVIHVLE